uniref:Auxin-responsive protein n=1 Tax=Salix viminalis TaxID=40686 RepID=A0A6N2KFP9_SALVM
MPQPNNLQFNAQRLPQQAQQLDQLPKLQSSLGSIIQSQQQMGDITQQSRQNMMAQTLPSSQVQAQLLQPQTLAQTNNILQQQPSIQSHQLLRNLPQTLHQQQQNQQQHIMGQNQQQSLMQSQLSDQVNQHMQMSDNQIQSQLMQKLQQQQQSCLSQQSAMQHWSIGQLQDSQRQLVDASQSLSRSMTPGQMLEIPQTTPTSLPQPNTIPQQMTKNNNQTNTRFAHPPQQLKPQQQHPGTMLLSEMAGHMGLPPSAMANQLSTAGPGQSGITDDVPSCSTSPSTNNYPNIVQPMISGWANRSTTMGEDMAQSSSTLLSPSALETVSSNGYLIKDLLQKSEVKPSLNISKNHNPGSFASQTYLNGVAAQTDYLDTSSSTTSVCLSQNDIHLQQNNNSLSYNPQTVLLRDTSQDCELQADLRNNILYGANTDSQLVMPMNSDHLLTKGMVGLGKDFSNNLSSVGMLASCENSKDPQHELSSPIVSKSFGVLDMQFNSIDSTINDSNLLNRSSWAPPQQQFQRMRTYTKVYKRGAVGRSIDITRYSGYDELKQDLARRFGIEGQLEDQQRIGWKLVYTDHENDVLLVGDDPWEEFVNCVRCIKILSPQEVQQMSLDGDFGSSVLHNQAGSSSDNVNA